jgi:hypothetical protein
MAIYESWEEVLKRVKEVREEVKNLKNDPENSIGDRWEVDRLYHMDFSDLCKKLRELEEEKELLKKKK